MTKLHDNPYQTERWNALKNNALKEAQKTKDEIDNEIALAMVKIVAFFMALGVIFLLFK